MIAIDHQDATTRARTGTMLLPHGTVELPSFMPVGTNASVKAIEHAKVEAMGTRLILANTYHLYLRPGIDVIRAAGGLHRFSGWGHNILTDSGGYQVFSLAPFRKILEDGVKFRSHIDGSYHVLTPEAVVELQEGFGSDILMPLDVCTGPESTRRQAEEALKTTTRWARKSVERWKQRAQSYDGRLFGIIQGQFFDDLRRQSAHEILELDTPGLAIGGLSVGEEFGVYEAMLAVLSPLLPIEKPRYVMGIGTPDYILKAVEHGIDLFDCVYPTRIARNGSVFTPDGVIDLKKARFEKDFSPIQTDCPCSACQRYSRAYLRQMFKCNEMFGPMLATEHNLQFLHDFLGQIRAAIREDRFLAFQVQFLDRFGRKAARV
ncbi:MAG: tRNA guanosine(34) transglycosylase Tgt [Spirochaetales bacterium]